MPQLPLFDRVMETSNSVGNGNIVLNGAVLGFRRFADTVGIGNQTYYTIQNSSVGEWEVGIGKLIDATTFQRQTIISSSNNNQIINLSIGQKQIFLSFPAQELNEDKNYIHTQSLASSTWVVNHNLNKYPSVDIVDSAGSKVFGNVVYISLNTVNLLFSVPFSGQAYFN